MNSRAAPSIVRRIIRMSDGVRFRAIGIEVKAGVEALHLVKIILCADLIASPPPRQSTLEAGVDVRLVEADRLVEIGQLARVILSAAPISVIENRFGAQLIGRRRR